MFKTLFSTFILLVCVLNVSVVKAENNAEGLAKLQGIWGGIGIQDHEAWSIKLDLSDKHQPLITYPSIPCAGKLVFLKQVQETYIFREEITEHTDNCINQGTLEITPIDPNTLQWTWYKPNELRVMSYLNKFANEQAYNAYVSQLLASYQTKTWEY